MRKTILLACVTGALALAGCDNAAEEADDTAADTTAVAEPAAAPSPAMTAGDGGPMAGTYEATLPDGTVMTQTLTAEGGLSTTGPDGAEMTGTWRHDDAGNYCETWAGMEEECYTMAVDADGTWTSTPLSDPEGGSATIVRKS